MNFLNLGISSNARTNWATIILAVVIAVLGFFKIAPDLETSAAVSASISSLIVYVKAGAWTAVFTAGYNLYNTIRHLLKQKVPTLEDDATAKPRFL